ncbi:MAG TPA: hypothetical protein VM555_10250 [Tahibacter sp.]|nr:hypothetical protein [Tahibacter sp.]
MISFTKAILILCVLACRCAIANDDATTFWCEGRQVPSLPSVPKVPKAEIDLPAPSGLSLSGMLATRLLQLSMFASGTQQAADTAFDAAAYRREFAQSEADREANYRRNASKAGVAALPGDPVRSRANAAAEADAHVEMMKLLKENNRIARAGISETTAAVARLFAEGADPDAPMLADLCITPRDLIVRARREYPESAEIERLLAGLSRERVPANTVGRAFLDSPSSRERLRTDPEHVPLMDPSPEKLVQRIAGAMRTCRIPADRKLSLCAKPADADPSIRSASPHKAVSLPKADPNGASRHDDWWQLLSQQFPIARKQFALRDGETCSPMENVSTNYPCARWYPVAAKAGNTLAGQAYHTRLGTFALRDASVLPDGFHVIGDKPALYAVRAGVVSRVADNIDLPTAFVWPEFARHRTEIGPLDKAIQAMIDSMEQVMKNLPSVVSATIVPAFDCDRACARVLSTELVAAAADWKHHLRPLLIDALFAIDTPVGTYVDNTYAVTVGHMNSYVAQARKEGEPVDDWTAQRYDGLVRGLDRFSVVAKYPSPFVGFTFVPADDETTRDRKFARGGLQSAWLTYPMRCAVQRAFHGALSTRAGECAQYDLQLRLSLSAADLPLGVVARVEDRTIELARGICLVDGEDRPVSGWQPVCAGTSPRVRVADVFRHELGHWLGIEHVADAEDGDTDIMSPVIAGAMNFSRRSRNTAIERIRLDTSEPLRISESLLLWK